MKKVIYSIVILGLLGACKNNPKEEEIMIETEPEMPAIGFFHDQYISDTTEVGRNDTFDKFMRRLGLDGKTTYQLSLLAESDSIIDLRKIRQGNRLIAYYSEADSSRRLDYLVYQKDRISSVVFKCCDSLAIWAYDRPVEYRRRYADVHINSSLWNDLKAAGASGELVMNLNDIYQWSVDFFTLQKNDRFRIIYTEKLCEGEFISIDTVHFSLFNPTDGKEVAAVRYQSPDAPQAAYWDKGGVSLKRMFLKAPLNYSRVSSGFSYARKHPITGKVKPHTGVDYAAPSGTPVQSIGDGTVILCGWDPSGGGNRIRIRHLNGYESAYLHLKGFAKGIRQGTRVTQGQTIGYVGSTGSSTGPHLDFRIWEKGRPINPLKLDSPASEPLKSEYIDEFNLLYDKFIAELNGYSADSSLSLSDQG